MSESLISSFLVSNVSESLISLKSNERWERIAQRKWAIVSELLRSLGNQMSESPALSLSKKLFHVLPADLEI